MEETRNGLRQHQNGKTNKQHIQGKMVTVFISHRDIKATQYVRPYTDIY